MLYLIGGYSLIDTSDINEDIKVDYFKKMLKKNHYVTIFLNSIFFTVFLFLVIIQYGFFLQKVIIITSLIVNGLLLVNSFYSKLGDIRILFMMEHDDLYLYSYLATSDSVSFFENKWLYCSSCNYILNTKIEPKDIIRTQWIILIINYIIDYSIYNKIENIDIFENIKNIKKDLPVMIQEYFEAKTIIYYKIMDIKCEEEIIQYTNKYTGHKLSRFMINICNNDIKKSVRKIGKKYGVLQYTKSISTYIQNIYSIFNETGEYK